MEFDDIDIQGGDATQVPCELRGTGGREGLVARSGSQFCLQDAAHERPSFENVS